MIQSFPVAAATKCWDKNEAMDSMQCQLMNKACMLHVVISDGFNEAFQYLKMTQNLSETYFMH